MLNRGLRTVLDRLHLSHDGGGLTDGQLLGRFVADREEAAFAALVHRHGPMVLGCCRRVLKDPHNAEDAFQATFLVLARKAASVVKREAVASFLYGVACRTAMRARARAAKRRARERQVPQMPHPESQPAEVQDWQPLLDRELELLPEKYRAPVVICDLGGKTRREAARQLGVSEGTLSSRLARARCLLARRLRRHGLALSGGALALALAQGASAAVPAALGHSTIKAAALVAVGKTAAAATPAVALMNEVMKSMLWAKLKVAALVVVVALGTGSLAYRAAGQAGAPETRPPDPEALQKENELLRLNVQVLLEKVRSLEGEVQALRAQAANAPRPVREGGGAILTAREGDEKRTTASDRRRSINNLKQIALAFHNFADTYGGPLPPAVLSKDGKPLLSWRVAILPWIEQDALYRAFHLDEPWDSAHNKKLLEQMPNVYALPGIKTKGRGLTAYQVFVGKNALFDGDRKPRMPADIPDGTSNTVLLVEAADMVPWTKPVDVPFGATDPRTQVGGWYGDVFQAALCDGSVRTLDRKKLTEETFRNAIMPADGNPLGKDW